MTSSDIRQSFLDFFKSKQHTIVPSSSLLPDSPNLLFTNAGMNQFVPIFLGQVKCPYHPPRAADTQKCIRAGGKHNDLDAVGLDTYHHTFFEMLGNWSFGDYFKKEAIDWAWELITEVWKFPKNRLYATVYSPDKSKGDPSDFDQDAYDFWAAKFTTAGLDPKVHIVYGNKKDNFWMMGETGPCGPCSELHVDLTPQGDTKGALVNKGSAECIEIWNLVFIQFNANPDGTFSPLPARHVDTGMGFERVASIIQCTKHFTDFTGIISNYETDIFRPIFDVLEKMSGKKYGSTLPGRASAPSLPGEHTRPRVSLTAPSRSASETPGTTHTTSPATSAPLSGEHTRPRVSLTAPSRSASETSGVTETKYSRRNLPHFERPWAKYMVTFSTFERRQLTPAERDIAMRSILYSHEHHQYQLYAACVMPDHAHLIFEPQVKEQDAAGNPVFWPLSEILQGIKSASSHQINKASGTKGHVWEKESMDRMIRGQTDMEEKFHYVCRNPWDAGVVAVAEDYPWVWTPDIVSWKEGGSVAGSGPMPTAGAQSATREGACAPQEAAAPLPQSEQEKIDVAFRVIADHIRTLSFAIADGIQPGNKVRNAVIRRILRRAGLFGVSLGFHSPFIYKLVDVVADTMGGVFPEIRANRQHVKDVIKQEEEAFNRTIFKGLANFESVLLLREYLLSNFDELTATIGRLEAGINSLPDNYPAAKNRIKELNQDIVKLDKLVDEFPGPSSLVLAAEYVAQFSILVWQLMLDEISEQNYHRFLGYIPKILQRAKKGLVEVVSWKNAQFGGREAFVLHDTYGFPIEETERLARERGLTLDKEGYEKLMDEQRARARAAQTREVISLSQIESTTPTKFVGFETLETKAKVLEVVSVKEKTAVILDASAAYAEMGGQVGDTGELSGAGQLWRVVNAQKSGNTFLHFLAEPDAPAVGTEVLLSVDAPRRGAIQRHHTVTHLLHWALHEVASQEASQKGSFVGPDKLTFDFNSAPLTPGQISDIEKLVNERILENAGVSWIEVPHSEVKQRKDVMQFFGDKYGDVVRVVQIGGEAGKLNGYSMELCGGTHTRATGEIGSFRIVSEAAVAAGVRRIEAVAGLPAYLATRHDSELIRAVAGRVNTPVHELEKKIESLLAQQKELEKSLKAASQKEAAQTAKGLIAKTVVAGGKTGDASVQMRAIVENLGTADGDYLQAVADALKGAFKGVVVLGGSANGAVSLVATVSADFTAKIQAGKIIQAIAPIVGGKGGGKPDNARGGGKDTARLDEALAKARELLTG